MRVSSVICVRIVERDVEVGADDDALVPQLQRRRCLFAEIHGGLQSRSVSSETGVSVEQNRAARQAVASR